MEAKTFVREHFICCYIHLRPSLEKGLIPFTRHCCFRTWTPSHFKSLGVSEVLDKLCSEAPSGAKVQLCARWSNITWFAALFPPFAGAILCWCLNAATIFTLAMVIFHWKLGLFCQKWFEHSGLFSFVFCVEFGEYWCYWNFYSELFKDSSPIHYFNSAIIKNKCLLATYQSKVGIK